MANSWREKPSFARSGLNGKRNRSRHPVEQRIGVSWTGTTALHARREGHPMKTCILGAGSLGSVIGGALACGGNEVHLVARSAHVAAIREKGLVLVDPAGNERNAPVIAHETPEGIGTCELVIVLCKAMDTAGIVEQATGLIGPETTVVSLQNGLGAEDILCEAFGAQAVIGGKTYVGGMLLEPGCARASIEGKNTVIGELDGRITERVQRIAATFEQAGLACPVSDNIMGVIWDKLLVNVSTGALCATTGLPYGDLYDEPLIREVALMAVQEGIDVAHALGVKLTSDDPAYSWELARAGLGADFKPSLLQSLEKGRKSEVDVIAGAVVREGRKAGIPTPVNQTLVAVVHGIERRIGAR
jgi:2-dehydropantoate 2-reductase